MYNTKVYIMRILLMLTILIAVAVEDADGSYRSRSYRRTYSSGGTRKVSNVRDWYPSNGCWPRFDDDYTSGMIAGIVCGCIIVIMIIVLISCRIWHAKKTGTPMCELVVKKKPRVQPVNTHVSSQVTTVHNPPPVDPLPAYTLYPPTTDPVYPPPPAHY